MNEQSIIVYKIICTMGERESLSRASLELIHVSHAFILDFLSENLIVFRLSDQ